jgi:hypothetical protein
MTEYDPKADLRRYLQDAREALLWKLDGLSEYDIRRPLVPTGTNLLGLVKHVTGVEMGYFGGTFGRPSAEPMPWDESDPMSDMFAFPSPASPGGKPTTTAWKAPPGKPPKAPTSPFLPRYELPW